MIIVTAAVIKNKNNKILITQRNADTHNGMKWEFPGGKIEKDEHPEKCIEREIKEELNIDIKADDIFKVVYHRYPEKTVMLLVYECSYVSGELKCIDCNDARWVTPSEMPDYDIADADKEVVEKLLSMKK